jgi:hypothetical protein
MRKNRLENLRPPYRRRSNERSFDHPRSSQSFQVLNYSNNQNNSIGFASKGMRKRRKSSSDTKGIYDSPYKQQQNKWINNMEKSVNLDDNRQTVRELNNRQLGSVENIYGKVYDPNVK